MTEGQRETLRFHPIPPPTDEEVGVVLATIATRVRRLLRCRGFDADAEVTPADLLTEASPVLAGISRENPGEIQEVLSVLALPAEAGDRAPPFRGSLEVIPMAGVRA